MKFTIVIKSITNFFRNGFISTIKLIKIHKISKEFLFK